MSDAEWSRMICKIDGNSLRDWLRKYTKLSAEEIDKRVGATGPRKQEA